MQLVSHLKRFTQNTLVLIGLICTCAGTTFAVQNNVRTIHFSFIALPGYTDEMGYQHRIYVASETQGYLIGLGDGVAINSLIDMGQDHLLLVDPGPDRLYAQALLNQLKKIEPETQHKKLVLVNSVARPEHVLANSTISSKQTNIYATALVQKNMGIRCPNCRKRLADQLQNKAIRKTPIKIPNRVISERIPIEEFPQWQALEFVGRTDSDLVLFNASNKVLYAGGLAYLNSIPDLSDANSKDWLEALSKINALNPNIVIGVGPEFQSISANPVTDTQNYLQSLRETVRQDFLAGGDAAIADKCCKLEQFQGRAGYSRRHRLNIQHIWREIEQEEMMK